MRRTYQVTKAAEFESLSHFRELIKRAALDWPQIEAQILFDLQLAIEEAAMNIITHGYAGMNPGSIIFTLEVDEQRARMTLADFGRPFEPTSPPAPDLEAVMENRATGGFGLFFIYQTMDSVDYQTSGQCNTLILVKNL
jgi:anti-sigma regulatory factor (Ser/Thr protein kinase)